MSRFHTQSSRKRRYSIVEQPDTSHKGFPQRDSFTSTEKVGSTENIRLVRRNSHLGLPELQSFHSLQNIETQRRRSLTVIATQKTINDVAMASPQSNIKLAKKSDNGPEMSYFQKLQKRTPNFKVFSRSNTIEALEEEVDELRPLSVTPEPELILRAGNKQHKKTSDRGHSVIVSDKRFVSATSYTPKYCYCLRCQMMYKMYKNGDDRLNIWGNYPCHKH